MIEILAATGHRPNKLNGDYSLTSPLVKTIETQLKALVIQLQPAFMISGMALGIDTLWAQIAIELHIPLIAAIPLKGQENRWAPTSVAVYKGLLAKAYKIVVTNTGNEYYKYTDFFDKEPKSIFSPALMQKRNIWMVDHCTKLVSVWDGSSGGTQNCIIYARKVNREIVAINLAQLKQAQLGLG